MRELRQVLGDAYAVGGAEQPPLKYLLCRANDLADVPLGPRLFQGFPA